LLLVAYSFPVSISVGLRMVILMPYLSLLGFSESQMGLIATAGTLAMAVLAVPMGILSDVRGRKAFLASSRLLVAFSDFMFLTLRSFEALLIANFVGGLGASMSSAVRSAFLADKTSGPRRRWAFPTSFALFSLGSVAGSLLAGLPDLIEAHYGLGLAEATRLLFALCMASSLTSFLLVLPMREERPRPGRRIGLLTVRSWDVIGFFCLSQALLGLGASLAVPWFSYYFFVRFKVRLSELGLLFAVAQSFMALGNVSASKMASRLGSVRTVVACQLASIGALLAIPLSPSFTLASAFYVLRAVLMNMATPVLQAYYIGLLRQDERASGSALQNSTFRSLGTYCSGLLMEAISLDMPFFITSLLYLFSSLVLYGAFGRRAEEGAVSPPLSPLAS